MTADPSAPGLQPVPRPPRGFVNVVIGGVLFERLHVTGAEHPGKCARSGELFPAGALIGFKDRDTLTPEQRAALFGSKPPKHLRILLTPDEADPPAPPPVVLPEPAEVVRCHPNPALLEPFRDLVAPNEYSNDPEGDWGMGNISTRAVRYSCGRLTRDDRPLDHKHDPAELALCERVATEAAERLANFTTGEGARIWPFFAAAVAGEPVPDGLDEALMRRAFGGTIAPGMNFRVAPMERRAGHWDQIDGVCLDLDLLPPEIDDQEGIIEYQATVWDEFANWFVGLPGLRERSTVGIGYSDADPGPLKPRMLLALTAAGSLVGVTSYVAHA